MTIYLFFVVKELRKQDPWQPLTVAYFYVYIFVVVILVSEFFGF